MVTIPLSERLKGAEPADRVLDAHPAAGEGRVEGDVLGRAGTRARFPARGGAGRVERRQAAHFAGVVARTTAQNVSGLPPLLERGTPGATAPATVPKMAEVESSRQ